jgi:hypothetical protein
MAPYMFVINRDLDCGMVGERRLSVKLLQTYSKVGKCPTFHREAAAILKVFTGHGVCGRNNSIADNSSIDEGRTAERRRLHSEVTLS